MIEWIVTSSALILLILFLRVIVRNRVSPRLRYALWGLALLRLVIPVSLWESPASVMTPVAAREVYQEIKRVPRYVRETPDGWLEIGHENGWTSIPQERVEAGEPVQYGWPERTEASVEALQRRVSVRDAFVWTWLAGAAAVGAFLLAVNLKFSRDLNEKRITAGKYRGRWVFVMDGLATPCLFGLFRPGIYLTPEAAADECAREYILAHEYTHFRQRDHVWAALRGVCLAVHWYNPLVWLAAYLSRRDCELSCDEGAVRLLGEDRRADYGRTLVGLAARRTTPRDLACCATTMTGGKSALKERIALLVKRPRTTAAMACLVAAACAVFAACTFTGAAVKEPDAEPPRTGPEETAEPSQPDNRVVPMSQEKLAAMAQRPLEELLRDGEGVLDFRVNWVNVTEWRCDMNSGDHHAVFGAEMMVRADLEHQEHWLAGNGVYAGELEDDFYRNYDGWIVFWWTGYLTCDGVSGECSVSGLGAGGRPLDHIDEDLGLRTEGRNYWYFHALPEDLPTELMDLDRPAEDQGQWLLLAQAPTVDVALYRSADDGQHVYLRVTNMSFQRFDRDLSGMELLPTLDLWDGDADMTVQVLYRRYEGTYFNGISNEPGIVAEQVVYDWNEAGRYWTEWTVMTQPGLRLTEDLPALADLPDRLVMPGTPEAQADFWLIGSLPEDGISAYYEQSSGRYWLRYGDAIQAVEGMTVCQPQMALPELHFDDLDGDGGKELIAISCVAAGADVAQEHLSVYEWDGGSWTLVTVTHDPAEIVDNFNRNRLYQFYEDGTAYIRYAGAETGILLDLSGPWELGYWDSVPDICVLNELQANYLDEDGQLMLILGGEILDTGGHFLHGYCFELGCTIEYEYGGLYNWSRELRSGYAVQQDPPELSDAYRTILQKLLAMSDTNYSNVYAVCDVTGNDVDELIVTWMPEGGISSSWGTSIYNVYGQEVFRGYGNLTFYDNGVISAPWSHNQGPACAVWPYTLYQCNNDYYGAGLIVRYKDLGSARARSNEVDGFEAVAYADLDGDGMVYYIGEDAYTEENPVDNGVYEAWLEQCLGDAKILPIQYFPLTEEAIS